MLKAIVNVFRFDRTNWRAAFLCMVAALVFWFFNALNKSYSTDVEFPVRFDYDLSQFAPVDALPHQLTVNVNGTGWELFREYVGFKQPELTIALQRPTEVRKIVGASLMPLLQPQLGKLKINYMVTDTLKIQLDEIEAHRFRVLQRHQLSPIAMVLAASVRLWCCPIRLRLPAPKCCCTHCPIRCRFRL